MLHEQFEHQNAAHTMENERCKFKNVANTVEMAASGSKWLQIAWTMNRTGVQRNPISSEKIIFPKQFRSALVLRLLAPKPGCFIIKYELVQMWWVPYK
jgi:hypothetical protein